MARKIDFITIRVAAFFLTTAWTVYLTKNIVTGMILGIVIFIIFNILYDYYDKKKRPYNQYQLAFHLAIADNTTDLIAGLIPQDISYIKDNNTIMTKSGELIYISFGFSTFGMSDTLKAIKAAKSKKAILLTIITNEIDRQIYSIIARSSINVNIITSNQLMRMLIKNNSLPDIKNIKKPKINISDILTRQAAGRFLLTGSIIAIMSIFMPIKIYYLVVSGICFTLGLLSLINPSKKMSDRSVLK